MKVQEAALVSQPQHEISGLCSWPAEKPAGDRGEAVAGAIPSVLVLVRARCRELLHHIGNDEARCLGARRKILEAFNILRNDRLSRHEQEGAMGEPVAV